MNHKTGQFPSNELIAQSLFFSPIFIFFYLILFFFSMRTGQEELTRFTIVLFAACTVLKIWSIVSHHNIKMCFSCRQPHAFPGEQILFETVIANDKLLPVSVKLRLTVGEILKKHAPSSNINMQGSLLWHQRFRFCHTLLAEHRGIYTVDAADMITSDFFGLYPKRSKISQPFEIVVYPKLVPLKPLKLAKQAIFGKTCKAGFLQDPVYFMGTREYQYHRPARHIDWKASAKFHRFQEKIFEPSKQNRIVLILDVDGFVDAQAEGAFESAVEALASLAVELDSQNYKIGFATNAVSVADTIHPLHKKHYKAAQLTVILEQLARVKMSVSEPMSGAFRSIINASRNANRIYFTYDPHSIIKIHADNHLCTKSVVFICCKPESPHNPINCRGIFYNIDEILCENPV